MRDQKHRHPDWILSPFSALFKPEEYEEPEDIQERLRGEKLRDALDYLGPKARTNPHCTHEYVNRFGDETKHGMNQ